MSESSTAPQSAPAFTNNDVHFLESKQISPKEVKPEDIISLRLSPTEPLLNYRVVTSTPGERGQEVGLVAPGGSRLRHTIGWDAEVERVGRARA